MQSQFEKWDRWILWMGCIAAAEMKTLPRLLFVFQNAIMINKFNWKKKPCVKSVILKLKPQPGVGGWGTSCSR